MQELMRGDSLDTSGNNDKKKEDDSLDECLVCSDQKRDVLFTPCGHVAVRLLILILFYVKIMKIFVDDGSKFRHFSLL